MAEWFGDFVQPNALAWALWVTHVGPVEVDWTVVKVSAGMRHFEQGVFVCRHPLMKSLFTTKHISVTGALRFVSPCRPTQDLPTALRAD